MVLWTSWMGVAKWGPTTSSGGRGWEREAVPFNTFNGLIITSSRKGFWMLWDKIYQLSLSWVSLSRLYIHNRISYSVKTKVKIPKCIFRILAGRQRDGVWQELGLLTAWFSLFLSSNKACTPQGGSVLCGICWGNAASCDTHLNRVPHSDLCLTWAWVCFNYVTVSSETQNLFDVWIFLSWISQKQFIDALKSLSCNSFYSFVYSLVRYFKTLWFFCNF